MPVNAHCCHAGFRWAGKGGDSVQVWQLCWFRLAMITLAAVRRAIDAHRKRRQAELEERESEEQAAREPLSLPADLIVACLSHLTEVSAQRVSEQCGGALAGALAPSACQRLQRRCRAFLCVCEAGVTVPGRCSRRQVPGAGAADSGALPAKIVRRLMARCSLNRAFHQLLPVPTGVRPCGSGQREQRVAAAGCRGGRCLAECLPARLWRAQGGGCSEPAPVAGALHVSKGGHDPGV